MRRWVMALGAVVLVGVSAPAQEKRMTQLEMVQATIAATAPLRHARGGRLPLYLWQLHGLGTEDEALMSQLLGELNARGLAALASWNPNPAQREKSLAAGLKLARAQHRLGLDININATANLHSFFDGSEATAHVTASGERFFDTSFAENRPMGCPFALSQRYPAIREQVEFFVEAYAREQLPIRFIFADWEIDGPIEWNQGWASSKRCARCREKLPELDNFAAFQNRLRVIRSDMQRQCFTEPVLRRFPQALVGNYAVYPHDGWRYWYDYFEKEPDEGLPYRLDQRAKVRPWAHEFAATGYTFAMPVTYTWYPTWSWYDYPNGDYRWFYNMLQVGSNAAAHTPAATPIIDFVHWHTTAPPKEVDPAVQQMSAGAYQELLWHLLLRGHDALFLWSPRTEAIEETRLLHEVYAASLEYQDFLTNGVPVSFEVPRAQGPVVSGLRWGDRVLLRRTDFDGSREPVVLTVAGRQLTVPRCEGACQILSLDD